MFFYANPKCAVLSDVNEELICAYIQLKKNASSVRDALSIHHERHSSEYYYKVRSKCPIDPVERAARFIYLNRTCFNGLYRVNLKGVFNVPKGTKTQVVYDDEDFDGYTNALKGAKLTSCDFSDTISIAGEGDFLYVDPPYTVKHNNNNFLKYNERIFSWSDQKRLVECLADAAKRGAKILVSNADHKCIWDLYRSNMWNITSVERCSVLASSSKYRRNTTEVVISNYLDVSGNVVDTRF